MIESRINPEEDSFGPGDTISYDRGSFLCLSIDQGNAVMLRADGTTEKWCVCRSTAFSEWLAVIPNNGVRKVTNAIITRHK